MRLNSSRATFLPLRPLLLHLPSSPPSTAQPFHPRCCCDPTYPHLTHLTRLSRLLLPLPTFHRSPSSLLTSVTDQNQPNSVNMSSNYDDSYDWVFISKGSIWHFLRQPSEKKVAAGFPCYDVTPYLTDAFYKGLRMRVRLNCNCVFFAQLSGINITKKSLVLMFEKIKHQCSGVKKNKITIGLEEIFQLSLFTNK